MFVRVVHGEKPSRTRIRNKLNEHSTEERGADGWGGSVREQKKGKSKLPTMNFNLIHLHLFVSARELGTKPIFGGMAHSSFRHVYSVRQGSEPSRVEAKKHMQIKHPNKDNLMFCSIFALNCEIAFHLELGWVKGGVTWIT